MVPERQFRSEQATVNDIPPLTDAVDELLETAGFSLRAVSQINIVIDEIYSNIARFAYAPDTGPVEVSFHAEPETGTVTLVFADEGVPYDPTAHEDPDVTQSAEERKIGGLGLFLVKKMMDSMVYVRNNGRNELHVSKKY